MIGIELDDKSVAVTYLPYRKKPCLVLKNGKCITKVATFNNEESARLFFDFLAEMLGIKKIDWTADNVPIGFMTDAELNETVGSAE